MKRMLLITLIITMVAMFLSSCKDKLDIQQSYEFQVETLPVPKRVTMGETVEIRCRLVHSGHFADTKYCVRYFQTDGKGELRLENVLLKPNDLYDVKKETFRMYYKSLSTDMQKIDIYFFDSFGNSCTVSFSFSTEKEEDVK